jgi:hypothetical protein
VSQQHLEPTVWTRAPKAGLGGEGSDALAIVVQQPAEGAIAEEWFAVVLEGDLLGEAELIDRGVSADTEAGPGSEEPRERHAFGSQVVRDLEHCWA